MVARTIPGASIRYLWHTGTDCCTFFGRPKLTVQPYCWRYLGRRYSLNFLENPFHLLQQRLRVDDLMHGDESQYNLSHRPQFSSRCRTINRSMEDMYQGSASRLKHRSVKAEREGSYIQVHRSNSEKIRGAAGVMKMYTRYTFWCLIPASSWCLRFLLQPNAQGQASETVNKKSSKNATTTWSKHGAHSFSRVVQPQNKHIDLCLGEEIPNQAGNERELDSTTASQHQGSAAERKDVRRNRRNVYLLSYQSFV